MIPILRGVLIAPKVTAALLPIMVVIMAVRGLKPRATRSGAAIRAGVPKPAAASMRLTKRKPMMRLWACLSGVRLRIVVLRVLGIEVWLMVWAKKMAPMRIRPISRVIKLPLMLEATRISRGTSQMNMVVARVVSRLRRAALATDRRRPRMQMTRTRSGVRAWSRSISTV